MSIADELQKLDDLRSSGALNEAEFALAKARVLNGTAPASLPYAVVASTDGDANNVLRKFARSSQDYWLGGVCGGLGARTPVPSWCWRVAFCIGVFSFG